MWLQVAKKIAQAIYSDDVSTHLEHRAWHGRQPMTLTAATLYITMQLGSRVFIPGLEGTRTMQDVSDICKVCVQSRSTSCNRPFLPHAS